MGIPAGTISRPWRWSEGNWLRDDVCWWGENRADSRGRVRGVGARKSWRSSLTIRPHAKNSISFSVTLAFHPVIIGRSCCSFWWVSGRTSPAEGRLTMRRTHCNDWGLSQRPPETREPRAACRGAGRGWRFAPWGPLRLGAVSCLFGVWRAAGSAGAPSFIVSSAGELPGQDAGDRACFAENTDLLVSTVHPT
jgi:hypothetical protein